MDALIHLVIGVVIAVVSAHVTVRLAIRRFRAEKWWERKADIYAAVFNALHEVNRDLERQEYDAFHPRQPRSNESQEKLRDAICEIYKVIDTSTFFLCTKAQQSLTTLMDTLLKTEGEMSIEEVGEGADFDTRKQFLLEKKLIAVTTCIENLSKCARRDLSIPKGKNV